jgi:hypothetical protein
MVRRPSEWGSEARSHATWEKRDRPRKMKNHAERYGARVHQRGTCNAEVCGLAHGPGGVGIRSRITCHASSLRSPNDRKLSDGGGLAQYPCGAPLAARSLWIDRLGVIDRPNYPTVPSENQRLLAFLFAFRLFFVGPCTARFATPFGASSLVAAGRGWRG